MKRLLVTSAGSEAGRSFISALRLSDEPVFIVGADTNAFQLACSDVDASYLLPSPGDPGWHDRIMEIVSQERVALVHSQSDADTARLSECRDDFPGVLVLPDHADVVAVQNRMHCNRLLVAADVPAPSVVRVHDRLDLDHTIGDVADRSGRAWVRPVRTTSTHGSIPVSTGDQAEAWIRYCTEAAGAQRTEFIVSTFLPGREFLFQGIWLDGALLTSTTIERMDVPVTGATGPEISGPAVARSVHRSDVNDLATKAVRAVSPRPSGPFSVVLREDETGLPRVTDITAARFRTLAHFVAAAGSELIQTYVRIAYGMELPGLIRFDAIEEDLYWVRGMDRKPHLFKGAPWVHRRAA